MIKIKVMSYIKSTGETRSEYAKRWNLENPGKQRSYDVKWQSENRSWRRTYQKNKEESDPSFRIHRRLQIRLWSALKKSMAKKSDNTIGLIGCSIGRFMEYLKAHFVEGMSFSNYGTWHIDHIRPCASFDLTDPKQQKQCFNFTNLQPLWAVDNLRKGDSYELNKTPTQPFGAIRIA